MHPGPAIRRTKCHVGAGPGSKRSRKTTAPRAVEVAEQLGIMQTDGLQLVEFALMRVEARDVRDEGLLLRRSAWRLLGLSPRPDSSSTAAWSRSSSDHEPGTIPRGHRRLGLIRRSR